MLVDSGIPSDLNRVPEAVRAAEEAGYDGVWAAETAHDPFLPLALAAEHSDSLELGTGIAVAFARSPMNLAVLANDLHRYSGGRFMLGLGSQIKPHIEKRFSMPWSHPADRMRELVLAMRAIWDSWNNGVRLSFRGDFYTHTLMTPFFDPGPNPHGTPKVFLAAVGGRMTEVAGEVADGMLLHSFTTERYLREVTLPSLETGWARAGRKRSDFQIALTSFVVTGADEAQLARTDQAVRQQIAFYGSTPAYRSVLELHGWGDLQTELNSLSKQGRWEDMGRLIGDDVVDAFAVVSEDATQVPARLRERFSGLVDRMSFYGLAGVDSSALTPLVAQLKAA